MIPSGQAAKLSIRMKRPNGDIIDVTDHPKVAQLKSQMQHWPGSTWIFFPDGTYAVKYASGTINVGPTAETFGVDIAIN